MEGAGRGGGGFGGGGGTGAECYKVIDLDGRRCTSLTMSSVVNSVILHAPALSLVDTAVVATVDRVDMVEDTEVAAVVRLATLVVDMVICLVRILLHSTSDTH